MSLPIILQTTNRISNSLKSNQQTMGTTMEEMRTTNWETSSQEIDVRVSGDCESNTLEIRIKREEKQLIRYEDGKSVCIESTKASPFPIPHLVFYDILFEPNHIYTLLLSTLQDIMLCDGLTREIAYQTKQKQGPLYVSADVTITPQTVLGEPCFTTGNDQDQERWRCAICLEEDDDEGGMTQELDCSHVFHDECILDWLCEHNTCPLCRTVALNDDDDDHPYYSD